MDEPVINAYLGLTLSKSQTVVSFSLGRAAWPQLCSKVPFSITQKGHLAAYWQLPSPVSHAATDEGHSCQSKGRLYSNRDIAVYVLTLADGASVSEDGTSVHQKGHTTVSKKRHSAFEGDGPDTVDRPPGSAYDMT